MISRAKFFFVLFLAAAFLAQPVWAEVSAACQAALAQLRSGGPLSEELLARLGFRLTEAQTFSRAVVLRTTTEEWSSQVLPNLERSFGGMRTSVNNMHAPTGTSLRPPRLEFDTLPDGVALNGHRYIVKGSGSGRRIFRVDIRETVRRSGSGDVSHYASVNLHEVAPDGTVLRQVGYADSPHSARGDLRWFHAHNANHEIVQDGIESPGFTQSALPEIIRWANDYTANLLRAGTP